MIYIGEGYCRKAYFSNGKVFKVPKDHRKETAECARACTVKEREVFEALKEDFKHFFPNPVFLKSGEIIQDLVNIAEKFNEDFEEFILNRCNQTLEEVYLFMRALSRFGLELDEIYNNPENYGVLNGNFVVVDWGEKTL